MVHFNTITARKNPYSKWLHSAETLIIHTSSLLHYLVGGNHTEITNDYRYLALFILLCSVKSLDIRAC